MPDLTLLPGTCAVCGCTDQQPCLGGFLFPASWPGPGPHRMVDDAGLLPPGETCSWLDEHETVCSAHSAEELDLVAAARGCWLIEEGEASHG